MSDNRVLRRPPVRTLRAHEMPVLSTTKYLFQITSKRKERHLQDFPSTHDFYEIIFVLEGECIHVVNDVPHHSTPSTLHILRPWDVHYFESHSTDISLMVLSVEAEEYEHFMLPYGDSAFKNIKNAPDATVLQLKHFQRLDLINGHHLIPSMSADMKLDAMRIIAAKSVQLVLNQNLSSLEQEFPAQFLKALECMHEPEHAAKGLPELIRLSSYSHTHLCRLMKRYCGLSPQQYIFQQRMVCAYDLLSNTDMHIIDVAETVGYASTSHFCSAFHSYYGMTPSKLRRIVG